MGNLCGCLSVTPSPAASEATASVATVPTSKGTRESGPGSKSTAYVENALSAASQELERSGGRALKDWYKVGKLVGHGAFAKVLVCQRLENGERFAVKIVGKNEEDREKQRAGIVKEIAIMRLLQDHPNVVRLVEVFEDDAAYSLVMELCTGGELFDQIIAKGHFSEREAAARMKQLLEFIHYAHSKQVIHRDLKPENLLLLNKTPDAPLKVIDFGTSDFCMDGQKLVQKFGTPYYVAPEVLRKEYDKSADVWSAGVIMYILLCGYPPFGGKTDSRILQKVQAGAYSFESREWDVVTPAAKDLISRMLVLDTHRRATPLQLLAHAWFQEVSSSPAAALGAHMVKRLRAFSGMCRMKRLALVVLARTLTDNDVRRLRELFVAMDTNRDGRIDAADLHRALDKVGAAIDPADMAALFRASDMDGGDIDYEEFIAAMLDSSRVAKRRDAVRRSFEQLDHDGDGFITAEDLVRSLPRGSSMEHARAILKEVDHDGDGRVGYAEFAAMMRNG